MRKLTLTEQKWNTFASLAQAIAQPKRELTRFFEKYFPRSKCQRNNLTKEEKLPIYTKVQEMSFSEFPRRPPSPQIEAAENRGAM
jgi:hypothetical protein